MRSEARSTLLFPCAAAAAVAAVFAASSCGISGTPTQSAGFIAPTGLAVTSAADRDVLFIANAGGDELRALNLCTQPTVNPDGGPVLGPDGGALPPDPCSSEDYRFVPGPIRVFPASLAVGDRPVRLAGVRLLAPDGGNAGAVLVGGADRRLKLIDAANVITTQEGQTGLKAPASIDLVTAPPVDVVAVNAVLPTAPDIEVGSAAVRAYALTQGAASVPAALIALRVTVGPSGPLAAKVGRCNLRDNLTGGTGAAIVGTRLAAIPKGGQLPPSGNLADDAAYDNLLYVADGTPGGVAGGLGDGAIEINLAQNAAALQAGADPVDTGAAVPDCVLSRRLRASDPAPVFADGGMADGGLPDGGVAPVPLRSLALSPRFVGAPLPGPDGGTTLPDGGTSQPRPFPPGSFLLAAGANGSLELLRGDVGGPLPVPPYPYTPGDGAAAANPRMEPLQLGGVPADVAFLKPPSAAKCPASVSPTYSCTLVQAGSTQQFSSAQIGLVGVATGSDGATWFVHPDDRRFLSNVRDLVGAAGATPFFGTLPFFGPLQPTGTAPQLTFPLPEAFANGLQIPGGQCCVGTGINNGAGGGGFNAGVTRNATWRLIWHAALPGLDRRGGTLSRINADGTLHVDFPAVAAAAALVPNWTASTPPLLDPKGGDVVTAQVFSKADGSAVCPALQAENTATVRREYSIRTLTSGPGAQAGTTAESLDLVNPGVALDPSCLPVGVTLEFRTGAGLGNAAWLVLENSTPRGRAANGVPFQAFEPRFDYPVAVSQLDAAGNPTTRYYPTRDRDVAVAFTITGPEPVLPGSSFAFGVQSGQSPLRVLDSGSSGAAFAGPTLVYTSPKVTNLVFTSVTGGNSLLQIDPSLLQATNGILVYR